MELPTLYTVDACIDGVAHLSRTAFSASVSSGFVLFRFLLVAFFLLSASLSLLPLLLLLLLLLLPLGDGLRAFFLGAALPLSFSLAGAFGFAASLDLDLDLL